MEKSIGTEDQDRALIRDHIKRVSASACMHVIRDMIKALYPEAPRVVCLCGSTKFKDEFIRQNAEFTAKGYIVLTVGFFGHADGMVLPPDMKVKLDTLHKRKIDLADEIFVINKDQYIGESTRSEIDYATMTGKAVNFLEIQERV